MTDASAAKIAALILRFGGAYVTHARRTRWFLLAELREYAQQTWFLVISL